MRRRRSLRTASATPEARCTLEAGRTIQLRPDAKDTQTTALPGSHHAIAARARPPSPPFRNVDGPPAAVRPPPSPPCSVYHSLSIVPVGVVPPPGAHGPPASGLPTPRRRAHRAPPGHRRAPGGLPARGGGGRQRRGPAAVRRARVPGVPDVRRVRTRCGAIPVDAVLPWVRVRQGVLTVPYRLRYQMAWNHRLSRAVLRVYSRVLLDV